MAESDLFEHLTPLQRVIYETDLLGLNLRDSMRTATQKTGFFIGQARYLKEREKVAALVAQYGPPAEESTLSADPREATHQIGSP